jgi:leader peptidase (prepilin peptidase) / N-methyltransferase
MEFIYYLPAIAIVFILGSSIGSFLNVVVYRVPAGLSILWPPSRCPHCLHKLGKTENIPVWGWIRLRGRCAHCRSPISIRYPLVEAATGLLFVFIGLTSFATPVDMVANWAFFSWLLALSLIDLDTMTLPNALTQSGLVVGLAFQVARCFLVAPNFAAGLHDYLMPGIIGMVLGIWLLDIIGLVGSIAFGQAAMGAGDAKLMAMMGAWLGWKPMLLAGFLACMMGAFLGGGAIALGWLDRRQPMPFGPFLAIGGALSAIWGDLILSSYLRLFFPS